MLNLVTSTDAPVGQYYIPGDVVVPYPPLYIPPLRRFYYGSDGFSTFLFQFWDWGSQGSGLQNRDLGSGLQVKDFIGGIYGIIYASKGE